MIQKIKLKHIDQILEDKVDYAKLMQDIYHYKNARWNKVKNFTKTFNKTFELIEAVKSIDPESVEPNRDCEIKLPNNIDDIPFVAMMSLHSALQASYDTTSDMMADVIAIGCYSANNQLDFDSDSISFKQFKHSLYDVKLTDALGLYNWIVKQVDRSNHLWEKLMMSVYVEDPDYDQAGGHMMNQFNVITTIKNTCADFNVTYEQAWQMPFAVIQTNSYSNATAAYIQHKMTKIKEGRMKSQRQAQTP